MLCSFDSSDPAVPSALTSTPESNVVLLCSVLLPVDIASDAPAALCALFSFFRHVKHLPSSLACVKNESFLISIIAHFHRFREAFLIFLLVSAAGTIQGN